MPHDPTVRHGAMCLTCAVYDGNRNVKERWVPRRLKGHEVAIHRDAGHKIEDGAPDPTVAKLVKVRCVMAYPDYEWYKKVKVSHPTEGCGWSSHVTNMRTFTRCPDCGGEVKHGD